MLSAVCVLALPGCGDKPSGGAGASTSTSTSTAASTPFTPRVTRDLLDASLQLGRRHLLANQLDDGRFRYEFDFTTDRDTTDELVVRRAGALWGVALIHRDAPTPQTADAIARGVDFFVRNSRLDDKGRRFVGYPGLDVGTTGTQALVCLAIIDTLPTLDAADPARVAYADTLRQLIAGLMRLRLPSGQFFGKYAHNDGAGLDAPSPYSDGEALLALVRYARLTGDADVRDKAIESAEAMRRAYVADDLAHAGPAAGVDAAFFQWGAMAYFDMYDAGWPDAAGCGQLVVDMARWMARGLGWTDDAVLGAQRDANSAWVLEGVIVAREAARRLGHADDAIQLDRAIDDQLYRIMTWQVGSSTANEFLMTHPPASDAAIGGVMRGPSDPVLRIDYTEHQMHAVLLARRYIYK
ncbi:MAG: hypothetical protein GC159_10040 [Phycisphaera sp.]|nr:hypothetical protein [Phycisphaera sp.]